MKYIFICTAFLILGCEAPSEKIDNSYIKTAEIFLVNFKNGDLENASKMCTPQMQRKLITYQSYNNRYIDSSFKFKFVKDSIIENYVYVFYDWKGLNSIKLIKENNEWKVSN